MQDDGPTEDLMARLPRSRPAVRSPRRKAPRKDDAEASRDQPPPQGSEAQLEALAWAGIAAAAEAATVGIRIAGRALESIRGTTERR